MNASAARCSSKQYFGLPNMQDVDDDVIARKPEICATASRDNFHAMTQIERANRFRALHQSDGIFLVPNP